MIALVPHALIFASLTIMQPVHYHNEIQSVKHMEKKHCSFKYVIKSVSLSVITIPVKIVCFTWIFERQ